MTLHDKVQKRKHTKYSNLNLGRFSEPVVTDLKLPKVINNFNKQIELFLERDSQFFPNSLKVSCNVPIQCIRNRLY